MTRCKVGLAVFLMMVQSVCASFILIGGGIEGGDSGYKPVGIVGYGFERNMFAGGFLIAVPETLEDTRPGAFGGISLPWWRLFVGGYVGGMDGGGAIAGFRF